MKPILLLICCGSLLLNASSQIARIQTSPSTISSQIPGLSEIKDIKSLRFDLPSEIPSRTHSRVPVYAKKIEVNISNKDGSLVKTSRGMVWTLHISIPKAKSVGLIFDQAGLDDSAQMYVYDGAQASMDSSIQKKYFNNTNSIAINPLRGSTLIIYIIEPGNFGDFRSRILIDHLIAGFREMERESIPGPTVESNVSTDCIPSVQCYSSKIPYARAVGLLSIVTPNVIVNCSCTLINNEAANGRPLVLTAFHCLDIDEDGWLSPAEKDYLLGSNVQFRFWKNACNGSIIEQGLTFTGLEWRQSSNQSGGSDYLLMEMTNPPGIGDGVNYAGWNRQASPPSPNESFIIHHPDEQDMRLTPTQNVRHYPLSTTKYWQTYYLTGAVTQGSSGAGLFNELGQVVGQLSAGWSSCGFTDFSDRYGKIDWAWNNNGLGTFLSPTQNRTYMNILDLTNIPINGPSVLACTTPATFSTYPNLLAVTYTWSATSGLQIISGQGTSSVNVRGVSGYGSGFLTLTLGSPTKGLTRNYTITRRIFTNWGGSVSGTYNSPTSNTQTLISGTSTYNNTCLAAFTNMTIPSGATPVWSANSLSPGVSWNQSTKDINVYFTAINQTADFTLTTTATGCTSSTRFRFKCVSNSSCGGINPLVAQMSPNPATSEVRIALEGGEASITEAKISEVRIYNKIGRLVKMIRNTGSASLNINVSDLPRDFYTVMIYDGKRWHIKKLIKR